MVSSQVHYRKACVDGLADVPYDKASKLSRVVDLDVDIGADAVDYKYVLWFRVKVPC